MSEYEEIEVSAKTLEDAVMEAAIELGVSREKVAYEIISRGTSGFLGIGGKKAVIKAHVKSEEEIETGIKVEKEMEKIHNKAYSAEEKEEEVKKEEEVSAPGQTEKNPVKTYAEKKEPRPEKKKKAVQDTSVNKAAEGKKKVKPEEKKRTKEDELVKETSNEIKEKPVQTEEKEVLTSIDTEKVEKFLIDVFAAMNMQVGINIVQKPKEREIDIDLSGEEMAVLIGKRGQTLDSLQYLASLVVNRDSDVYIRVKVDIENYRERRKATLENLARNMAQKAKRTGKSISLEPMNPYERRVIHSALQNDKYVTTHSEGDEPYRHVVITLKEGVKPEGNYNRNRNRGRNGRRGGGYNKKRER